MPRYKVIGELPVLDYKPGETFSEAEVPSGVNLPILLMTGMIEKYVGADGEGAPQKVACPACVEQKVSRPPKFDELADLQKHYANKHPALVAPETMPAEPGKEQ